MEGTLRSMTGFGAAQGVLSERYEASVHLASVNARFFELAVRTQPRLDATELEQAMRAVIGERVVRGRVQAMLRLQPLASAATGISFRWDVAEALAAELARRPAGIDLAPLSLRDLLALPGFAEGLGEVALSDGEREALLALVGRARDELAESREREAAALLPQIDEEVAALDAFAAWLAGVNAEVTRALLGRLRDRVSELLGGVVPAEDRLLVEAAVAAERANVSEEVQRLRSHLGQVRTLLEEGVAVGKKLDFLAQELLREVNTAASKCREAGMGEQVVTAKAAVEKLREQFANLE
jgi:uncharacterized protein (TIGR00255 family)